MLFSVPDGTFFDPNFGLGDCFGPPDESEEVLKDLVSRASARVEKYGYTPLTKEDFGIKVHMIASEVGDDEEVISNSKAFVGLLPVFHEMAGMMISEEDTSISPRFGNLAEDLIVVPDGYYQTYHNVRNTSQTRDMSYLDVPKLRLAIDIRPGRMDHSSTNDGKASLVGSRNSWIPRDSPIKGIYEIFSLYQDVNLGLLRDKRFAYLPQSLGGYGKPIPFSEPSNFERFNKAFRQGQYSELNREIVRRTINFLHKESLGIPQDRDPLLGHIVRFESSFHDWIKNKSIYAPTTWLDIPQELGKHSAGKLSSNRAKNNALLRLASERRLVTESQLSVMVEHNELCKALLSSKTIVDFKRQRDAKIAEWRSLSLYTLQGYGLIKELRLDGLGLTTLRPLEILRFTSLVKDKRYNLKSLLRDENFYWPEAMKEVYEHGPMKVHFTSAPKVEIGFTHAEHEWDIEDTELIGALDDLEKWVRDGCTGMQPRKLVNDDDAIISLCKEDSIVMIVTEDRRLCREVNRTVGCPVVRVPVEWYYRSLYFGDGDRPWVGAIRERYPNFDIDVHMDIGSIESHEELLFYNGCMAAKRIEQPFDIHKPLGLKDGIKFQESELYDDSPPEGRPDLFDRRNLLKSRPRHKKTYRRM
uniref:RNA-dependent RNA polymerase n=1 Tax=Beauveria bassiana splipalmivirus 1 TaxID=3096631 RepID=A0AAF1C2Y9_9VIRU|nr:MAG: RNA-dependent RNA polymerase [Beauveria bassiana splipalmivirus 1]